MLIISLQEAQRLNLKTGSVVRNKSSLFGNRKLRTPIEDKSIDILSKSPLKTRPQIPFSLNSQLLPDKQTIPVKKYSPTQKDSSKEPVYAKVPYVTNVRVDYPSRVASDSNPVSTHSNTKNIVRRRISEETAGSANDAKLDSEVVLHKTPNGRSSEKLRSENTETDETDDVAKSVYNDVIRALKKTRSPMYAELNEQAKDSKPIERTQSIYSAKDTKVTPKIQKQVPKPKKRRPDRVSQGNTPADVRLALAALNTVIDDEIEKGAESVSGN